VVEQFQRILGPRYTRFAARPLAPEHRRQQFIAIGIYCALLRGVKIGAFVVVVAPISAMAARQQVVASNDGAALTQGAPDAGRKPRRGLTASTEQHPWPRPIPI
jgi:hypothetical protein